MENTAIVNEAGILKQSKDFETISHQNGVRDGNVPWKDVILLRKVVLAFNFLDIYFKVHTLVEGLCVRDLLVALFPPIPAFHECMTFLHTGEQILGQVHVTTEAK